MTGLQHFEGSALARLPRDWLRAAPYKPTTVQSQVHRRVAMAQSITLGGGKGRLEKGITNNRKESNLGKTVHIQHNTRKGKYTMMQK